MKKKMYIYWAVLYVLCVALSFVPETEGMAKGFVLLMSCLFFVPPIRLLIWAVPRERYEVLRLIRNLSIASLASTLAVFLLTFLFLQATPAMGYLLYVLLILVSAPMIASGVWALSLFAWACLLFVCIHFLRKK